MTTSGEKSYQPIVFDRSKLNPRSFNRKLSIIMMTISIVGVFLTTFFLTKYNEFDLKAFHTWRSSPSIKVVIEDFNIPPKVVAKGVTNESYMYDTLLTQIKLKPKVHSTEINKRDFNQWVVEQTNISFQKILDNIADNNLNNLTVQNPGMQEGVSIASPSKENPNYFYQWIRDASITINTIINRLHYQLNPIDMTVYKSTDNEFASVPSNVDWIYFGTIFKYFNNAYNLQRTPNLSGVFNEADGADISGLGEPKFNVDSSAFMHPWGRPQNDGPALRIISAINFLSVLYDNHLTISEVSNILQMEHIIDENVAKNLHFHNEFEFFHNIVYYDLKYVIEHWSDSSFDLWEEINSKHFFTSIVQLKSMKLGIRFIENDVFNLFNSENNKNFLASSLIGKKGYLLDDLKLEYNKLLNFMFFESGYLSDNKNHIVETPEILSVRSGLDIGTILGCLITHDEHYATRHLKDDDFPFDVDDSGVMNTLIGLANEMSILYPINHVRLNLHIGVVLGRYPEDVYDGNGISEGNPWFLATTSAAEFCYKLVYRFFSKKQDLVIPFNEFNNKNFFWDTILEVPALINNYSQGYASNYKYELVIKHNSPAYNATMDNLLTYGDSFLDRVREHVSDDGEMSEQLNKYTGFLQGASNLTWSYGAFWNSVQWRQNVNAIMTHI